MGSPQLFLDLVAQINGYAENATRHGSIWEATGKQYARNRPESGDQCAAERIYARVANHIFHSA